MYFKMPALLLSSAIVLSSCSQTTIVVLKTDAQAHVASVSVKKSSGNTQLDAAAMDMSKQFFRREVRWPRANHTYVQYVKRPATLTGSEFTYKKRQVPAG